MEIFVFRGTMLGICPVLQYSQWVIIEQVDHKINVPNTGCFIAIISHYSIDM